MLCCAAAFAEAIAEGLISGCRSYHRGLQCRLAGQERHHSDGACHWSDQATISSRGWTSRSIAGPCSARASDRS
jgi:hypothetical protein